MTHKEATKIVLEITRRLCKRQRVVLRFYDGREVSISCCHIHWPHAEGDDFGVGCLYMDWENGIEKSQLRYAVFGQTEPSIGFWVSTAVVAQRFTRRGDLRPESVWTIDIPKQ